MIKKRKNVNITDVFITNSTIGSFLHVETSKSVTVSGITTSLTELDSILDIDNADTVLLQHIAISTTTFGGAGGEAIQITAFKNLTLYNWTVKGNNYSIPADFSLFSTSNEAANIEIEDFVAFDLSAPENLLGNLFTISGAPCTISRLRFIHIYYVTIVETDQPLWFLNSSVSHVTSDLVLNVAKGYDTIISGVEIADSTLRAFMLMNHHLSSALLQDVWFYSCEILDTIFFKDNTTSTEIGTIFAPRKAENTQLTVTSCIFVSLQSHQLASARLFQLGGHTNVSTVFTSCTFSHNQSTYLQIMK